MYKGQSLGTIYQSEYEDQTFITLSRYIPVGPKSLDSVLGIDINLEAEIYKTVMTNDIQNYYFIMDH